MSDTHASDRHHLRMLDRHALEAEQLTRLNRLLTEIQPHNTFYATKLGNIQLPLKSLSDLQQLPLTTKAEFVAHADQHGIAGHRTYPLEQYTRMHRTSGTLGKPLTILDTSADWQWWIETWQFVLDAAGITEHDRAFMAFSFGPFIGFWSAYDALVHRGVLVIPAGGLSTLARLQLMQQTQPTCVCCTPTYALHLAEVAQAHAIPLAEFPVRSLIVAGEPGGSIPTVRQRIESAWQAEVIDHSGATEVGPWGFPTSDRNGLHVIESEFIAEFLPHEAGGNPSSSNLVELVLTSLGRRGMPVLRYRTGDLVLPDFSPRDDCRFVTLTGGILGRADDMVIIRGVNVFPSSIEAIIREFPEVREFRVTAVKLGIMDDLLVEVEDPDDNPSRISDLLQHRLGLRIQVQAVPLESLPRFEAKSKRFVDKR